MTKEKHTVEGLRKQAIEKFHSISSENQLEEWRIEFLGRKGAVPLFLRKIGEMPAEERKEAGSGANALRKELEGMYEKKKNDKTEEKEPAQTETPSLLEKFLNIFRPKETQEQKNTEAMGHLHPLTLTTRRIQDIFSAMDFHIVEGPEIESGQYNFDYLNIPIEHPARAETDTFYVENTEETVLRTHTSPVQLRAVLEQDLIPPFKILSPGRVFRAERTDATHDATFYQFEGLVVGENITIADFKGVIETFYSTFFQEDVKIRLRTSFFPFVEPGFEVDMSCVFCKQKGCRICKKTGWVEIMGAGMVHPSVLKNMNIDPEKYQGFAFGGAQDRLAMLKYGVDDIRLFWSGDIRFLKQFS